jgi:ABC-type glycerol-3-phosphate transport system substrate-binding protein
MKKVCVVLLSLVLLASLAQGVFADKIKLTVFEYQDLTDAVDMANLEELLAAFYAANPDIELEMEYGFSEAYHNKLQTLAAPGSCPTSCFCGRINVRPM